MNNTRRSLVVALVTVVLALLACKAAPPKEARIGETVTIDDSTWVVVSATNIGGELTGITGNKKTAGKFVKVEFKITNTGKKDESILDHPKVIDDQDREFRPMDDQSLYIPQPEQTLTLESLPPSIMKRFSAIYELPADAKGLRFEARELAAFGKKQKVALGI